VALVLLRFALGCIGIAEGIDCFTRGANLESRCLGIVLALAGIMVSIGVFTSYSAAAIAIATVYRVLAASSIPGSVLLKGPLSAGILIVLGVAVTLLGPGVFSLDFRFFGRREIVIPRRVRD
jgi:uncharacterized membrane protein YphA (DoxX/SURF4 family)